MVTTTSTQIQTQVNGKADRVYPIFVEGKDGSAVKTNGVKHDKDRKGQSAKQSTQNVLLLKAAREKYTLVEDHPIPELQHKGEILVKVSLGLPRPLPALRPF